MQEAYRSSVRFFILILQHVLCCHDIDAGSGNVLQQHVADTDRSLRSYLLEGRNNCKDLSLWDILRRLAADDCSSGAAAGQADR